MILNFNVHENKLSILFVCERNILSNNRPFLDSDDVFVSVV